MADPFTQLPFNADTGQAMAASSARRATENFEDGAPIQQTEQPVQAAIDSPNQITSTPLPPEVADQRAAKASMGLSGKVDKTQGDFKQAIVSGQENPIRQDVASQLDLNRFKFAQDRISQKNYTSPEELQELTKLSDPDTIFEKHYAQEYVDKMNWPKEKDPGNWLYNSMTGYSEEFDYIKRYGSTYTGFTQFLNTLGENARSTTSKQSWMGYIADLMKDPATFGLYTEYKLRTGAGNTGFFQDWGGLGSNLEAQGVALYRRALTDFEGAKDETLNVYKRLSAANPALAEKWVHDMMGLSQSDILTNDMFTALNVSPVLDVAKGLGKSLISRSVAIGKMIPAVRDMTTLVPASIPPKVAAPAVAGNLAESAIQKVTIDRINEFSAQNNPLQELRERLPGLYDFDKSLAMDSPGRGGREAANRLGDMFDSRKEDSVNTILEAARVNKIPAPVLVEARVRAAQEALADQNRGVDNTVAAVSEPLYVKGLNVYVHNVAIVRQDGDLFGSVEELRGNAKLNGHIIKGDYVDPLQASRLQNLIKAFETHAKNVKVNPALSAEDEAAILAFENEGGITRELPTGVNKAQAMVDKLKAKLAAMPKHETGATIEEQFPSLADEMARLEVIPEYPKDLKSKSMALGDSPMKDRPTPVSPEGEIKRQGAGYYINKLVYINHGEDFVKDGLITTDIGKQSIAQFRKDLKAGNVSTGIAPSWFNGWVNAAFGRGRNPAERLSINEMANRVEATHGPSVLLGLAERGAKAVKIVPSSERRNFDRMLKYTQKAFNEDERVPGIWFDNPQQIEDFYQRTFKKLPPPEVSEAYFAYKSMVLDDLILRNLRVRQLKHEMGFEQHNIKFKDKNGNASESGFFEGSRTWKLPDDNKRMLYFGPKGEIRKVRAGQYLKQDRAKWEEDLASGKLKIIQIADPKSRPFRSTSNDRIEYVMSYNTENKPIGFNHVNRLGGGHMMPEWPWYLKSANVDAGVYEGDHTVLSFRTRAQAQEAQGLMENARNSLKTYFDRTLTGTEIERFEGEGGAIGKDYLTPAQEAIARTGIPFTKFHDWYKKGTLNINEPFHVVQDGGKIIDMGEEGTALRARHPDLIDGTKGGSLLGKAMGEFTQERDAEGIWTLKNKGTQQNPLYAYEPAELLDPITAMERSYSRLVNSIYKKDMDAYGRTHWLEQAKNYLEKPEAARDAPFTTFSQPAYRKDIPSVIRQQLESNRKQIEDFIGKPSTLDQHLRGVGQALADSVYRNMGDKNRVAIKLMDELPKMRNPIAFVRNMAFHMVEGVYALKPFIMQATTMGNVAFISPRSAAAATAAAHLYGMTRFNRNPEILAHLDMLATKMAIPGMRRFRPGEFTEMWKLMETNGFQRVGNEHAFSSNVQNNVVTSAGKTFLKAGTSAFDLGSAFTRVAAYATAYLEHRENNPFSPLGNVSAQGIQNRQTIMNRAALLDHHMSSAFNTKLHTGAMSLLMQFHAYDLRIAEMMFGKNLDPAEKARMFIFSGLSYGLRGGAFMYLGLPIAGALLNEAETAWGYVPGNDALKDFVMNGVPAGILAYLTGKGDLSKGTWYNIARFGNKGVEPLEDFFSQDKTASDILLGVAGNVWLNTIADSWKLGEFIKSFGSDQLFPLTVDDVLDSMNEVASLRDYRTAWKQFKIGSWLTKNETRITDQQLSTANILIKAATGVVPVDVADVWTKQKAIRDNDTQVRKAQKEFGFILARGAQADLDKDYDNAARYFTQANKIMQLYIPSEKWAATRAQAYRDFGVGLLDRVNYDLYIKRSKDFQTFENINRIEQNRNK